MKSFTHRLASVVLLLGLGSSAAYAQEEFAGSELGHCAADIASYCSGVRQGGGRVVRCLQQDRGRLEAECRAAVSPTDFPTTDGGVSVTVKIDGIKSEHGVVIVTLGDDPTIFPRGRRTIIAAIAGNSVVVTFRHLKPNTYAITAFHDVNENGAFDMTAGDEGFATTDGKIGIPDFDAFALKIGADSTLQMSMAYL